MTKLSKNGITVLKKQYRSVLLKCLAINTGVFMLAMPAMADTATRSVEQYNLSADTSDTIKDEILIVGTTESVGDIATINGNLTIDNGGLQVGGSEDDWEEKTNANLVADGATITLKKYGDGFGASGNVTIKNSEIKLLDGAYIEGEEGIAIGTLGNLIIENSKIDTKNSFINSQGNLTIKDSTVILSNDNDLNDENAVISGIQVGGNAELSGSNNIQLHNFYISADGDLVINGGNYESTSDEDSKFMAKSITFKDGTEKNIDFVTKVINIEGGKTGAERDVFEARKIEFGDDDDYLNIKGGESVFVNEMADGMGHVNVSGGKLDLTTSEFDSLYVNISGGEVNLTGSEDIEANLYARKNYDISGGTINMKGNAVMDNIADIAVDDYDFFDFNISGGTINVSGIANEISSSEDINFTGGTININKNAQLGMFGGNDEEPITVNFGDNAVINLSGTLKTNLMGNQGSGTVNINDETAKVDGTLDWVNLNVNATNSMNTATFAGKMGDLNVNSGTFTINGDEEDLNYFKSINVKNGAALAINDTDIKTSGKKEKTTDIVINGGLQLDNAIFESGNDADDVADNSDMLLDGASVTAVDSDIEANGDITVRNSTLKISSTNAEYDDEGPGVQDANGMWADKSIAIENSSVELNSSYIDADGNIDLSGNNSNIKLQRATIKSYEGNIGISGGKIALNEMSEIKAHNGSITIANSNVDVKAGSEISAETLNISGDSIINVDGAYIGGDVQAVMSGGTVNLANGAVFVTEDVDEGKRQGSFTMTGGTINMDNSYLGSSNNNGSAGTSILSGGNINVKGGNNTFLTQDATLTNMVLNLDEGAMLSVYKSYNEDENEEIASFGDKSELTLSANSTLNLAGTLNANINNIGLINTNSHTAKIGGNLTISGGTMNVGLNKAVIDGDATFKSGSTLNMAITDEGNGLLKANKLTAEDGAKLALTITKKMAKNEETNVALFDVNEADNHFSNELSNARYSISTEDGKNYKVVYEATASDVVDEAGGTTTNAATAEAWETILQTPNASETAKEVATTLNQLSMENPKAYVEALTAIAPEAAPAVQQAASETAGQVFSAVGTRLSGGSVASTNQGMSSGDALDGVAVWAQGMANKAKLSKNKHSKGFDSDTYGTAMGVEKQLNRASKIGVGYAYSKTDIDSFKRKTKVKTHTALVYGEYKPSNWYINAVASYGWSDYKENKIFGLQEKYDVEALGLQAMTGYDIAVTPDTILTPEAGLRYVHIKNKAYTSSMDERIKSEDSDVVTGVIGAKFRKTYALDNGVNLMPELRAAVTYDISHDNSKTTVTMINGAGYEVEGKALNRYGTEIGAGVTAELNDSVDLSLGYEGKFRKDYQDHTGLISAKYKF